MSEEKLALNRIGQHCDNAVGDVLFIHGLGGDGKDTWTHKGTVGTGQSKQKICTFFPEVLAADYPETNVWTLDYSASSTKWRENLLANELTRVCSAILQYLVGEGLGSKPMIIVCHSLGGIVAKDILRQSASIKNNRLKQFYQNTKAVSFLATPHKGSKWADLLKAIDDVLHFIRPSDRIEELSFDSSHLEELSAWYRENIAPDDIETQAFYEQKKTKGILIVPHVSANPDVSGCRPMPVEANHIDICKPTSKESPVYVCVSSLIQFHILGGIVRSEAMTSERTNLRPETIVIGVLVKNEKVLMVRRRHGIDKLTWQFVAGRLREGEDEEECIVREIKEETNIRAKVLQKLDVARGGIGPNVRHYFACEYLDGNLENMDVHENLDVAWVDIEKVRRYVTTEINKEVCKYLKI